MTAQKRQQSLSDVGLSIVAANAEQLSKTGVTEVSMLTKVAPGLTVTRNGSGYAVFSMRGVNYNAPQLSALPAVTTYIDEAALAYAALTEGALLDIERVEVLKGPQGTLFGQNATGGSINIIAAKPTDHLAYGGEVTVNHFGGVSLQGYVSGPLSDTLRARLSASTEQWGAWQKGYFGNHEKHGDADRVAARLLLDWTPTDRLKISVNLNGNYNHGEPQVRQLAFVHLANPAGCAATVDPALCNALVNYPLPPKSNRAADADTGYKQFARDKTYQAVLRADYDVTDNVTLTSQTNYVYNRTRQQRDADQTSLNLFLMEPQGNIKSFSQEVRLTGKIPSQNITYILGANYQRDRIDDGNLLILPFYSALPFTDSSFFADYHVQYRSAGVFANADWEFVPGLTLTGGARYTWAREALQGCLADGGDGKNAAFFSAVSDGVRGAFGLPAGPPIAPGGCITLDDRPTSPDPFLPFNADLSQKEHNLSWRVGLNYKPERDMLLYALVSRGYKAGGFPAGLSTFASEFQPVKQEQLTSYEVGAKVALLDRALRVNVSGFYYDYKDKQVQVYYTDPNLGLLTTFQNVPKITVKGIDADVTLVPVRGLTIRSAITYLDSKAGTFQSLSGIGGPVVDIKGNQISFAPKINATVDAEYDFNLGAIEAFVGGAMLHNSHAFSDLNETPELRIPSFTTYDARIGVRSPAGWHASLWVRNLTNEYYWTGVFASGDVFMKPTGLPRTFGATLGANF